MFQQLQQLPHQQLLPNQRFAEIVKWFATILLLEKDRPLTATVLWSVPLEMTMVTTNRSMVIVSVEKNLTNVVTLIQTIVEVSHVPPTLFVTDQLATVPLDLIKSLIVTVLASVLSPNVTKSLQQLLPQQLPPLPLRPLRPLRPPLLQQLLQPLLIALAVIWSAMVVPPTE